ncbi:MAG: reverse transcriptase/maturase family protein [Vallitalea sp.]|jgi:retron-type reverse transcriptase|nr:reverse transcriptase/maturase family protein [Vallitalea sp.]
MEENLFVNYINEDYIKEYYLEKIQYKSGIGIDKINKKSFKDNLEKYSHYIVKKINNNTYKFTQYREILISKGRNKHPRVISIPTIKDKITLTILKDILYDLFNSDLENNPVKTIINNIKDTVDRNEFDYYIKLDLKKFYDSLDHKYLLSKVSEKITKPELLNLIVKSIKTPTIEMNEPKKGRKKKNDIGVPQGLPISNILANIYFIDFDKKHIHSNRYKYFRYVDDILILCKKKDADKIKNTISNELTDKLTFNLELHDEKKKEGDITQGFSYLGYLIKNNKLSVRDTSLHKLELAIEELFVEYKNSQQKNLKLLIWKLNIKITGIIDTESKTKYGWVIFFSQINNTGVLRHLDRLVTKLIHRFNLEKKINENNLEVKKFLRTYYEVNFRLNKTNYIFKPAKYNLDDKKKLLNETFKMKVDNWDEDTVNYRFKKIIHDSIKDLEKDLQNSTSG